MKNTIKIIGIGFYVAMVGLSFSAAYGLLPPIYGAMPFGSYAYLAWREIKNIYRF